jgi:MFS family permease
MSPQASTTESRIHGQLWPALILLVISVAVNYIDRSNLSLAAPLIKGELNVSAIQLGSLLSAFFWTYAGFQLVAGWLADRLNVSWVLAAGFFLWSLATAATGLAQGFVALFLFRLVLGIAESIAFPCYSKILAGHFAEQQRGLANSLIDAGSKLGPAVGTLAGGILMAHFGWRPFFIVLGLSSMFWLPLWFYWQPRGDGPNSAQSGETPSVRQILARRSAWATFLGMFCANYLWYFLLTWLPFYLVRERHLSMERMGALGAMAYIVTASTTTISGFLADRAIARGATPTRVRKSRVVIGLAFSAVIVGVTATDDLRVSMFLLLLACTGYGTYTSSHWAITQTLAGPFAAGRWTGLQNFVGNLAGIAAPFITGLVVDRTGRFFWAFGVVAAIVLAGACIYGAFLGRVEPVAWCGSGTSLSGASDTGGSNACQARTGHLVAGGDQEEK